MSYDDDHDDVDDDKNSAFCSQTFSSSGIFTVEIHLHVLAECMNGSRRRRNVKTASPITTVLRSDGPKTPFNRRQFIFGPKAHICHLSTLLISRKSKLVIISAMETKFIVATEHRRDTSELQWWLLVPQNATVYTPQTRTGTHSLIAFYVFLSLW